MNDIGLDVFDYSVYPMSYDLVSRFFGTRTVSDVVIVNAKWESKIGFGEYSVIFFEDENGNQQAEIRSECMDNDDDKEFGKKILSLILDKAKVVE